MMSFNMDFLKINLGLSFPTVYCFALCFIPKCSWSNELFTANAVCPAIFVVLDAVRHYLKKIQ